MMSTGEAPHLHRGDSGPVELGPASRWDIIFTSGTDRDHLLCCSPEPGLHLPGPLLPGNCDHPHAAGQMCPDQQQE